MKTWFMAVYLVFFSSFGHASVIDYFEKNKSDPNVLYAFLKEMPKGGELHYHFAGGAYPEAILALTATGDYCLNPETFVMSPDKNCRGIKSSELMQTPKLYAQTLRAWSMKDFIPGRESGHDHFFAGFPKFMGSIQAFQVPLLAEIMQRAADQNELYLEIMMTPVSVKPLHPFALPVQPQNYAKFAQHLKSDAAFNQEVNATVRAAESLIPSVQEFLECKENPQKAACGLTVRFQYHVLREQPLEQIFTDALLAFTAASRSDAIVGVNLVQEEDGIIALRDYRQQMKIFEYMHSLFPRVHIALHAGELSPETNPDELRFHIREAIEVGHAERIGHGVDIGFEDKSEDILKKMAQIPVAIEINLVSNERILNVKGKQHPLNDYISHQVPVVLSTDDEGLLRTDLTRQYLEAALQHGLDYPALKQISRNALVYSFLPEDQKQKLLQELDTKFLKFEKNY